MNLIKWIAFATLLAGTVSFASEPVVRVFEGQVTDQNGKPVRNATVEWGVFNYSRKYREVVHTDDAGHYRLETRNVGIDYRLGVSAVGLAPRWRDWLVPSRSDQKPTVVNFVLPQPITLRGRVLDETGAPLEGVTIFAQSPSSNLYDIDRFTRPVYSFQYPGPERSGITDSDGSFTIRDLPRSTHAASAAESGHKYDLYVRFHNGSSSHCGFANSNEVTKLKLLKRDFLVGEGVKGEIHGKVVDAHSHQPINDFAIVIRHRPAMNHFSNENGEFRLHDLRIGPRHQLFVYAADYAPAVLTTNAAERGGRLKLVPLKPNPSLKGIVANVDGQPIAEAEILFGLAPTDPHNPNLGGWSSWRKLVDGWMGWELVQRMTTASDGKYSFCLKMPLEPGELPPRIASNQEIKPRMMIKAPGYARIILDANEVERRMLEGDTTIELQRECAIAIKPLLNGEFCSNATVSCSGVLPNRFGSLEWSSESEDGTYRVGLLQPGHYRVKLFFPVGASRHALTRSVIFDKPDTVELSVDYQPGDCTLRGKSFRFSKITLSPERAGDVSYSTIVDADGNYEVNGVAAGTYNVSSYPARSQRRIHFGRTKSSKVKVDIRGETTHDFEIKSPEVKGFHLLR